MSIHSDTIMSVLRDNNGYITASQVTNLGIPRRCLTEMLLAGDVYKVTRGIYALPKVWEDEMYFLQYRYAKGVFSHGTALYLHGLTDRTPHSYTMTFPRGYNSGGAKKHGIVVKNAIAELYDLGITETASPCGNMLKVYDAERTLCDIVRGKNADNIQLVNHAMKSYALSKSKNIYKLMNYAEKLRIRPRVQKYMEILL